MSDRESGTWPPTVKRNTQCFCKRPRYRIDGREREERERSLTFFTLEKARKGGEKAREERQRKGGE